MYVWVKPRPHTHTKGGLRFPQYLSSSSVPHFLQMGLLLSPIIYKSLLKVLCPVSLPITTLDCVLLKDNNWVPVARSGPEINSLSCLCVLQGPRQHTRCWFSIQRFIFLLIFCLEAPKKGSGQTNRWTETSLASLSAISFPLTPACPGTQYSPTACRVGISFNAFWHCRTKGDVVLAAWSAFRAAWLSEQMLIHFSGRSWVPVSWTQTSILYTPTWKTVACLRREILNLLFTDCPQTPAPDPSTVLDPSINQTSPLVAGGVSGPLVHSSPVNIQVVTLYLGSRLKTGFTKSTPILNMGSDFWSLVNMQLCPWLGWR